MLACRRQLSGLQLSEDEQRQLDLACMRFADGAPTDEQLHSLRQDEQQHAVLQRALETGAMPQEQQDELEALRRVFATGVPTEDEVLRYQTDCRRIAELEGRKQVQALQKTKPEEQKPRLSGTQLLLLVLGAALLALGCVLLAKANLAAGIALTAAGALALIGAVLLRGKQAREGGCITTSAITDEENQALYDLRRGLNDFLLRFFEEVSEPERS